MKIFFLLLVVFILPMWVYSQATPPSAEGTADSALKPALPIRDALAKAEGYLKEKNIDMAGQYLQSVQLLQDEAITEEGYYWRVQWVRTAPRAGMDYALRIYMDGIVIPEEAGS